MGKIDEALSLLESFKEESRSEVYDMFRHQWESRMNYLLAQILLDRGDLGNAAAVIEENLREVRQTHSKKREGGFLRLLGEVQIRGGESDSAISNLSEAITILKEVGNPRQLWQAHNSLASAFDHLGRPAEAREQWGAAAATIQGLADGLSDTDLREGFLNAKPIREILSKGAVMLGQAIRRTRMHGHVPGYGHGLLAGQGAGGAGQAGEVKKLSSVFP